MFAHPTFPDYSLLDSGNGEKLERFGEVVVRRPDPQALWRPRCGSEAWELADLRFRRDESSGGSRGWWDRREGAHPVTSGSDRSWPVRFRDATFLARPTPFKHLGLFPEQATNWEFLATAAAALSGDPPRLLNLFGYTGASSILAAQAGYKVTHVDASRTSISWARENAEASGLEPRAIRWILDDALRFAQREVRRGTTYTGLLIDPPHYGRGPKGEKWQFEDHFASLLESCARLLEEDSFLVLSTYAIGYSPLAFMNVLAELPGGEVVSDELALPEEGDGRTSTEQPPRFLPAGFCARWKRGRLA